MSYSIIRMYQGDTPNRTLKEGLTREEAVEHCSDPETSSSTATSDEAMEHTRKYGAWFDGFSGEDDDADTTYNGWKNWETWNVALWIQNDEGLYNLARACDDYGQLLRALLAAGVTETPDGVSYCDTRLSFPELNRMVKELGQ